MKIILFFELFILLGIPACKLERTCGSQPVLDFDSAKEAYGGRNKIYLEKTKLSPAIYCGRINLSLYEDFSFTLIYRPDSCDCFHGYKKLTGKWEINWWDITLYPESTDDSYLPWLMEIPINNSFYPNDTNYRHNYFTYWSERR